MKIFFEKSTCSHYDKKNRPQLENKIPELIENEQMPSWKLLLSEFFVLQKLRHQSLISVSGVYFDGKICSARNLQISQKFAYLSKRQPDMKLREQITSK